MMDDEREPPKQSVEFVVVMKCGVVVMNGSFRVRDGSWCGFGSGGFERQIHEKENVSNHEHLQINHKILPSSAQTPNAMCRALC